MSQSLKGCAAIVTGAGQGVGQGVARALAAAGANILIAQRSSDSGEAEAAHLRQTHKVDAHFIQTDVTDQAQVERMIETGVKLFGKVDILVNNAGASKASARQRENYPAGPRVCRVPRKADISLPLLWTKYVLSGLHVLRPIGRD